ncbi:MAG: hypothetical protein NWR67_10535 [Saprospiraceae bacterium]|jgi:hypothetical protein|nr:hypothetical protein [Saprospiraceae bacterium]MDP4821435.1 hypothetical protein [Saprospiraceae bacterium]
MGFQSRKRGYKSRRERLNSSLKSIRMILIFGSIALLVLIYKNRWDLWNWLKTYFY